VHGFDRKRNALAAADAKRDNATLKPVAPHRVNKLGSQDCAGCADRMAVHDRAARDIDDLFRKP